jgi:hypothetical protein
LFIFFCEEILDFYVIKIIIYLKDSDFGEVVLEFKLRALHLLSRCPALVLVTFRESVVHFCLGWP